MKEEFMKGALKKTFEERVERNIKKGLTLTEVASIEEVSYGTLRNRLRESETEG